ncbi:MAG: hypothetical protein ACKVQR_04325 [Aquabacterium sp.]
MAKPVRKAWNGGSREAAMAAANTRHAAVTTALRDAHREYLAACGPRFADVPFRSALMPGYLYLPIEGVAILEETARRIYQSVQAREGGA